MEAEDYFDQHETFQHDDEDENDSDIEARLYAEVYHSNTIIGEDSNANKSTINNQSSDTSVTSYETNSSTDNFLHREANTIQQDSSESIICNSNLPVSNNFNNDEAKEFQNKNTNDFSKKSLSTQKTNNVNDTTNSMKRTSSNCLEVNISIKKKKYKNENTVRELQSNQHGKSSVGLQSNKKVYDVLQCDDRTVMNSYNINVIGNVQPSINVLSPQVINLLFRNSQKKKKKNNPSRKEKNNETRTCSVIPNSDNAQKPLNTKLVEKIVKDNSSNKPIVIDISSESSNESFENDSKYSTIVATDKKLRDRESGFKKADTQNQTSDSEESIFEVPVPPKPVPPIIEVNDSDNERKNENESEENSFLYDNYNSKEILAKNNHKVSLDSDINETQETFEIISDSDDSNSLILNCTDVQTGASSLSEIRKINRQTLNSKQRDSGISCSSDIQHSRINSMLFNEPLITEKQTISSKSRQKPYPSSKNLSSKEYFFQPMNEQMQSFYNNSWGGENFDMDKVKRNMANDPSKWVILNRDIAYAGPKKKRYFGMTCSRCHKDGHRQNDCPVPNKGPTCYMCGTTGHFATYCPHTKCLTCGSKQTMYRTTCGYCEKLFCSRCQSQGHKDSSCPDLWRRYHHTTNSLHPKIPLNVKTVMKSKYQLFCCNCTKSGHDSTECRKLRWSQHFSNPSFVTHYNGPVYELIENVDAPLVVDDIQENSCNVYNKHSYSSNCDNSANNSMTSNIVSTNFPRSNRRNENSVQSKLNRPLSVSDSSKTVIFNVCQTKDKLANDTPSMKRTTLKLIVSDRCNPNSYEKWKTLSDFLKGLIRNLLAEFRLEYKDKQFFMYMTCSRKYSENLTVLFKQYATRTDFERSRMLLSSERTLKVIWEHLSQKFSEMKNLNEDILTLYGKTRQLRKELFDKDGRIQNEVQKSIKVNELVVSQQKLLMLLYREGFANESLIQLKRIYLNMAKTIEQAPGIIKLKKKAKFLPHLSAITFKLLFSYLYYYNNVFSPYEPEKLDNYIQKYKDNLDRRNKLLNSSLLFPQGENGKQDSTDKVNNQDGTSNEKTIPEDLSEPLISMSERILEEKTKAAVDTTKDKSDFLNSNVSNQTPVSSKEKPKRSLNGLYLQAIAAKNQNRKENLMQHFRNFLKNARNCLEKASKLNSPRLREDIINLQRDLEDETYVSIKQVRKFKKKFREETLRLQGITNKHKVKNATGADNVYTKFCASL